MAPHWWCGTFSPHGEQLLTQHIAQSGLSPAEVALCQYCVYSGIHQNHPLSFTLFSNILEKLIKPLQAGSISEEDLKLFWDATKKLLPSCYSVIRKIRKVSQKIEKCYSSYDKSIAVLGAKTIEEDSTWQLF